MNENKEFTEYEYNQMIIDILEKNIQLNNIDMVLYLFISIECFLIGLGHIVLNIFVLIPLMFAGIKIWINNEEIKLNNIAIQHIEDLRDKHNKT
jgi:hypothetical protein